MTKSIFKHFKKSKANCKKIILIYKNNKILTYFVRQNYCLAHFLSWNPTHLNYYCQK